MKLPVMRFTLAGGEVHELWYRSSDKSIDVAIIPIHHDPAADITAFDVEDFFDESNNPENIGPGDEVFFPGLFWPVPGTNKIMPLVRHGNLAMLPDQQIQGSDGYADTYLIEARSIGGMSGSPVFVRETVVLPVKRSDFEADRVMMHGGGKFKLLGLAKSHWDVQESKINDPYVQNDPRHGVNMGIAQVVPARKILEVLNEPTPTTLRRWGEESYTSRADAT